MMRSLFSGVTGLRSHQTRMDVIGNNIANVNTVGFKKSTVTFKDLYSETISAASSASGVGANTTGGVNPRQIGLGAAVNSISQVHTAGSAQYTGNGMDVAISGDGYFIVQTPSGNKYTRAGNFTTDLLGNLVSADGYYVQTVPAIQEAVEIFTIEGMGEYNLIGTNIDAPTGGVIHSGNPTVDPAEIAGQRFSFQYVPDVDNPWKATMQAGSYIPTQQAAEDKDGILSGIGIEATAGDDGKTTWSADDITALVEDALNNTSSAGTADLEFKLDNETAPTQIQLVAGDVIIATYAINNNTAPALAEATNAGTENVAAATLELSFTGLDAKVTVSNYDDNTVSWKQLVDELNGAKSRPAIITEEQGEWQMVNESNEVIDTVTVAASLDKQGGYSGEFRIMTTELGQFTLKIQNGPLANMQELSTALADSYIEPQVTSEWGVNYTPPTTVQESGLQTLTIDFDLYQSLAINTSGAIIAQLTKDQQVTVDGQTINLKAGDKVVLGYVPLANFNNPTGLEKVGDNLFEVSANSGEPVFGLPGTGNAGALSPSNLEMSNVDLSEEIVNMIITQRGFQANSRIITVTDTMLEELVNLKR